MNAYLQIGLGLVPGAVITILMLCKRRVFQFKGLFFALLLTVACVGLIIAGTVEAPEKARRAEQLPDSNKTLSLANALVLSGATKEAKEIADQYGDEFGYDEECRLLTARIAFMDGEYEKASALYSYLCKNTDLIKESSAEVGYARQESVNVGAELAMIEYLKECGQAIEDYGYAEDYYESLKKPGELTLEDALNKLKSAVKDRYELDDEVITCAKAVKAISEGFSGEPEDGKSFFRKQKNILEEVAQTYPALLEVACVNKAWIMANVQGGDFSAIAEHLNANSSYHELMVAAELYMSKLVKKSSFSETFQAMDREEASVIKERLNDILEKNQNELNSAQRKALKSRIDAFSNQFKEPVLGKIKTLLLRRAETVAGTDETKVYLEVAKIENVFGDEVAMDSYLSKAIYGSQDNADSSYVANMAKIIGVLTKNDTDSRENIKNVTDYFNEVLDHSLTINVEKIVSPQYQEKPEQQEEQGNQTRETTSDSSQDDEWKDEWEDGASDKAGEVAEEKKPNDPAEFAQQATDYVSRTKSAITIGKIDATDFETVRAMVQVDGRYANNADELKAVLKVRDCGIDIQNFELKKVEYQTSNVVLLCDVSGSMEESIGDLRNAVITFIQDKDEKENLSVITFSSGIDNIAEFGKTQEELIAFAKRMSAWGGTDMYNSAIASINLLNFDDNANNVLILMTDGQDNYPKTPEQIRDNLGKLAAEKNVIIYTMGLGSAVDTNYLETIAGYGNGSFIYVSGSSSLSGFYDMLHAQLNCQYELTYKAEDTMSLAGRVLELEITDENVKDEKAYSLPGAEEAVDPEIESLVVCGATDVAGLYPRSVSKQLSPVAIRLKGEHFDKKDSISVTLKGVIDYELEVDYENEQNYKILLPPTVAIGTYDVEIVIAGKKKVLTEGFTVYAPGGRQVTVFGPYRFSSLIKEEVGENGVRLKGDVVMNGWLRFEGSLYLEGDLENDSCISAYEESGSYVDFDKYTATGLGKVFADNGKIMPIPALYDFKLYNELNPSSDYENYRVDNIKTGALKVFQLISFDSPSLQLRPDNIRITYRTGMMDLPFQKKLFNLLGQENDDMFKFNFEGSAVVTNRNVGVILDTEFELPGEDGKPAKLITIPAQFKGGMKAKINTIKGEYLVGAKIGFDILTMDSSLMAEVSWKGNLKPNTVEIGLDSEIPVKLPTGFPIEINKIHVKGEGLDQNWANATFTGIIGISSFQVKSYAPALEKFVGDVSLLTIPEASLSIRPDPFMIQTESEIKLFGEITINKTKISVGTFDYENPLLKMNGEEVKGIAASVKQGMTWDIFNDRVQIDFSGTTKVDAHSRFVGLGFEGLMKYNIEWWLIDLGDRKDGDFALGLYTTRSGEQELVFIYYLDDGRHVKKGCYFIDKNGSPAHRKEL